MLINSCTLSMGSKEKPWILSCSIQDFLLIEPIRGTWVRNIQNEWPCKYKCIPLPLKYNKNSTQN